MRHKKRETKLGRERDPRRALLRSLATSFVISGKITTTIAKAKAIKPIVEKYITVSKEKNLTTKRKLAKYFYQEKAIRKLLNELGPKYKERKGGYTRIIHLDRRLGDDAEMAILELV